VYFFIFYGLFRSVYVEISSLSIRELAYMHTARDKSPRRLYLPTTPQWDQHCLIADDQQMLWP